MFDDMIEGGTVEHGHWQTRKGCKPKQNVVTVGLLHYSVGLKLSQTSLQQGMYKAWFVLNAQKL